MKYNYFLRNRKSLGKIQSGHTANIFCTKFIPNTNNQVIYYPMFLYYYARI